MIIYYNNYLTLLWIFNYIFFYKNEMFYVRLKKHPFICLGFLNLLNNLK